MNSPKIGDLVRVKALEVQGIVVGEELIRHHQYLEKELYLKVLINSPSGTQIRDFLSDGCEIVEQA